MYFVLKKTAVSDLQKLESTRLASHVGTHVRIRWAEDNSGQVCASSWLHYHFKKYISLVCTNGCYSYGVM